MLRDLSTLTCRLRRRFTQILAFAGAALGLVVSSAGQEGVPESNAKAAFVFHLTQFVTWPEAPTNTPFKIGVLGPDPFGSVIDKLIAGETAGGREIRVERSSFLANLGDCQLIYVSPTAPEPMARIVAATKGRPILLVGESGDFLAHGGMVRLFRTPERKLRLQVSLENVQAAGLKMSSQLLRVADVQGAPQ